MTNLTKNQTEVLRNLESCERSPHCGRTWTLPDGSETRAFAPLDFGGSNGSHHSATATALAKRGLVLRIKHVWFSPLQVNRFNSRAKGSCHYVLTDAGRAVLREST